MRWRLFSFTRNYYFVASLFFLLWMLFFDSNDFITQYQMYNKVRVMEQDKRHYLNEIEKVKKDRKELLSNPKLLEKFAREKYLMKKPSEDIYIVIDKKKEEEKNHFF